MSDFSDLRKKLNGIKPQVGGCHQNKEEVFNLTDEQKRILNMMINKDSIVKMSMEIGVSQRTISAETKKIKELYSNYLQMEITKMISLIN